MANKKFSEFTVKTDNADVDFLVGYEGSDNVRISPENAMGYESGSHTTTWNTSWDAPDQDVMNYVKVGKMCTVRIFLYNEETQDQDPTPITFTLPFNAASNSYHPIIYQAPSDSELPSETRSIGSQFIVTSFGSNIARLVSVNGLRNEAIARIGDYEISGLEVMGTITYITQ
jgi:hypothetical protein